MSLRLNLKFRRMYRSLQKALLKNVLKGIADDEWSMTSTQIFTYDEGLKLELTLKFIMPDEKEINNEQIKEV